MVRSWIAALVLVLYFVEACAGTIVPQQIVLYKNSFYPTTQVQPAWLTPANAYTSATAPANFDGLKAAGAHIHDASVRIVWQANSPGSAVGTGLYICPSQGNAGTVLTGCTTLALYAATDSGPSPWVTGCGTNPGGPFTCGTDITATLNAFIAAGTPSLWYVGVAYGNGYNGPAIYAIEIFINWLIP